MRRALRFLVLAPAFGALALTVASAHAEPANSVGALFATINLCLKKSSFAGAGEITLYFSLRQDGSMWGRPRVTYLQAPSDPAERSLFVESVATAFGSCFPAQITPQLGKAIAGKPLSMRIVLKGPDTSVGI